MGIIQFKSNLKSKLYLVENLLYTIEKWSLFKLISNKKLPKLTFDEISFEQLN
jgi:hypothetical protein